MWRYFAKDYPTDTPLLQEQVEPGRGIVGCEMHELKGWGEAYHTTPSSPRWENFPSKRKREAQSDE